MDKLNERQVASWLHRRKAERRQLWIGAVIIGVAFVAAWFITDLWVYLIRFGPIVFIGVCIEDELATRHERKLNHTLKQVSR